MSQSQYHLFTIPKNYIPKLSKLTNEWDKYDDNCYRNNINIEKDVIYSIINCQPNLKNCNIDNYTTHYIKYNITEKYTIDEHVDSSDITIIVYLNKDENIRETFYVNNINTKHNWRNNKYKYHSLIMWNNPKHKGTITGSGKRNILCFFINLK